jgi:raffinose/stachyose/melibiose transport system substrate-binding protein
MSSRKGAALLVAAGTVLGACGSGSDTASGGPTEIEFFQFKTEAVATFDGLIEEFEQQHPDIRVRQNNVPAADTVLRTRLVKNDVPDVMTVNGNGETYGDLASAGIFRDFTGDPALEATQPQYRQMLDDLGGQPDETNGVPFAVNANGMIYNTEVFDELGLQVPTTWSELMQAAQTAQDAGIVPFYLTWKDAWTTLPPFNVLAQNIPPEDFWEQRVDGDTSFGEAWPPVLEALDQMKQYGPPDPFRFDYNTGNRAMADGEAAMYPQGTWAIPSIRSIDEDAPVSTFVLPASDDPERNRLVSGVDVVLTMPRGETPRTDAALEFVRWLVTSEPAERYATEQTAFSAVRGVRQDDPALAPLNEALEAGDVVEFADHHLPSSIPTENLLQGALIDGKGEAFLAEMDRQFDVVLARRGELGGGS